MKKVLFTGMCFLAVLLAGCAAEDTQADGPSYIERGLEELVTEDYEKAQTFFEIALEESPEDGKAEALNRQTSLYIEARSLFEEEKWEEAETKAVEIRDTAEGSDALQKKGEELISEIHSLQEEMELAEEEKESAAAGEPEESEETVIETTEAEEVVEQVEPEENMEPVETAAEAPQPYTYDDFKGYYLHFASGDRSHSDMIITLTENYITVGWWMSEFELMEITDKRIEGNTLTLDYFQGADGAYIMEDTWGSFQVVLDEQGGQKSILTESGEVFYFMTEEEVYSYDYILQDFILSDR